MAALETGNVATVLGWRRCLRLDQEGIGFAVDVSARAAMVRIEYMEGMVMGVWRFCVARKKVLMV